VDEKGASPVTDELRPAPTVSTALFGPETAPVADSWVAAIGLLMLGWALRGI
jgi:hypothetical protein